MSSERERIGDDERGKKIESHASQRGRNRKQICIACRFSRRKCVEDCPFAPYFPANDIPSRYYAVHQIFGAKNFLKLLRMVKEADRAKAAQSMVEEATMRIQNKVYGSQPVYNSLFQQVQTAEAELKVLTEEVEKQRKLKELMMPSSSEPEAVSTSAQPPSGPASASASASACAACMFLRQKCPQDCIFAPFFPAHDPQKFDAVQKIFKVGYLEDILKGTPERYRYEAVNNLVYEANCWIRDPVNGCMAEIATWIQQIQSAEAELDAVRALHHKLREAGIIPSSHVMPPTTSLDDLDLEPFSAPLPTTTLLLPLLSCYTHPN